MFLDEARVAMQLSHANIVHVYDVGKSDDTYYIVMEYLDGVNLKAVMERNARTAWRLPAALSVYLMSEVCKALSYAHTLKDQQGGPLGIVHRDVSPPNILMSRSGEVKLADFGLAKAHSQVEATDPGIVKGKFSYLSPEASFGEKVDQRADLFAAGIGTTPRRPSMDSPRSRNREKKGRLGLHDMPPLPAAPRRRNLAHIQETINQSR